LSAARLEENSMSFIERVMRVMTHISIGSALGLATWALCSGWQMVTGQITPGYSVAEVKALMSLANAGEQAPMHLVPVQADVGALPPCQTAPPLPRRAAAVLTWADL
jgi:hypothetical protein